MAGKDELIYRAKLAEQAERYDDMMQLMKQMAELGVEITAEERNFYSFAYKNAIGIRRASWRSISEQEKKAEDSEKTLKLVAKDYREKIEKEVRDICNEALATLEKHLIPKAVDSESNLFFMKMTADYFRYLAEVSVGDERKGIIEKSQVAYAKAFDVAKKLPPCNPIRIGLALNFSVFYYEILNSHGEACQLAQQAFDAASAELNSLPEESQRESWMILQLLRDNLTLWRAHEGSDGAKEESSDSDDDSTTDKNAQIICQSPSRPF
uniref:14-3-3 domain-containing protein n=1 Tax=Ditylenchus dipsaci TaxID=166011 RepID=A0A915DWF0_9BILA